MKLLCSRRDVIVIVPDFRTKGLEFETLYIHQWYSSGNSFAI